MRIDDQGQGLGKILPKLESPGNVRYPLSCKPSRALKRIGSMGAISARSSQGIMSASLAKRRRSMS